MSRVKYNRYQILNRLAERLHVAAECCERHGDEDGDILFDAIAMTGYELQSFESAYWRPFDAEMADLINHLRFGCLEFENEKPDVRETIAVYRLRVLAKYLIGQLEEMAEYFEQIVDATPPQTSPIAILFNQTFKLQTVHTGARNGKQYELDKEREARHRQLIMRIVHMQTQTDAALACVDRLISELANMYKGEDQP